MIRWSASILATLLAACASVPPEDREPPLRGTITLASGPCTGLCPVYRMTLTPNDRYRLIAEDNTMRPGRSQGALPVNSFRRAHEALQRFDIGSLQQFYTREGGNCPEHITDLPTIEIARIDDGLRQLVTYDTGCIGMEDQDRLDRLHETLREVFRIRELVAVGEPPKPEPAAPPAGTQQESFELRY